MTKHRDLIFAGHTHRDESKLKHFGGAHIRIFRARASWAQKLRRGEAYKEKGEPIGTKPDRLAVTAVDCAYSCNFFSLTSLSDDATFS